MWPTTLDMSKLECKRALRTLELDAYAHLVSAFRAQGDLSERKLTILNELQCIFRISVDRHKAELRRASNDERLCTIARRLSCGGSVSAEWTRQAKRVVPLLSTLDYATNNSCDSTGGGPNFFRVLADHVLVKTLPVLHSYPDPPPSSSSSTLEETNESKQLTTTTTGKRTKKKDQNADTKDGDEEGVDDATIRPLEDDQQNLVYLKNGVAIDARHVKVESIQPREYMERLEAESRDVATSSSNASGNYNPSTFIRLLVEKYKKQQLEKENESFKRYNHLSSQQHHNSHHNHVNSYHQIIHQTPPPVPLPISTTTTQYSASPMYFQNTTVYNNGATGIIKPYYPNPTSNAVSATPPSVKSNYDLMATSNNKPTTLLNPTSGTGKNSLKISQIIDTMSQHHTSQLMAAAQYGKILPPPPPPPPSSSNSIISAQAIKQLTSPTNNTSSTNTTSPSNTINPSSAMTTSNTTTPTIVKLTPAPSLNSSTTQNGTTTTNSSSTPTNGSGGNIIKHLVLPKAANQKLIILPNSVTNGVGDPQASAPPSSSSSSSSSSSPNLISKLVLLKSKSEHQTVSSGDDFTTATSTQLGKNFKILGSPSILNASTGSSGSSSLGGSTNKSVLNINNHKSTIVSMKPIKIIEAMSSTTPTPVESVVTDNGNNKRKTTADDEDENGNIVKSVGGSTTASTTTTTGNLIRLKLDNNTVMENGNDTTTIRNGLTNSHNNNNHHIHHNGQENAATTKRIKLVDVDLNEEQK